MSVDESCPGGGQHRLGTPRIVTSTAQGLEVEADCRTCEATLWGYLDLSEMDVVQEDDTVFVGPRGR